jgi:hypothetical protein
MSSLNLSGKNINICLLSLYILLLEKYLFSSMNNFKTKLLMPDNLKILSLKMLRDDNR